MFQTIYSGQHTCRNLLKAPQIIMADSNPPDSSILLSFETDKSLDGANGRISNNSNIRFSAVKSETKDDIITNSIADVSRNQSSSTEYDLFPSPDFTMLGSTVGSNQGEALSSSHSFHSDMDLVIDEVDFENMFACPFSWWYNSHERLDWDRLYSIDWIWSAVLSRESDVSRELVVVVSS